jgi:Phage integrase family
LHLHDLRRELACRLLESCAELHDVRDFLGHANITTTSRCVRSTTLRLERALTQLEQHEHRKLAQSEARAAKRIPERVPALRPETFAVACQFERSEELVTLDFVSWNRIGEWLRRVDRLRRVA